MLTLKNNFITAGLVAGVLAANGLAHASSVIQTFNIPTQTPPITQNIGFNLFDSNLGTLNSVTVELVVNGTADIQLENATGTPQPFTNAFTSFGLNVTGPVGVNVSTTLSATIASGTVGPGFNDFPGTSAHDDSGVVTVAPPSLGIWQDPGGTASGTDLVFASGPPSSGVTAAPGVLAGGSGTVGDVNSFITLIYNYTPPATPGTPEPGTWALVIASASVSLVGLRRRRASKVA